MKQRRDQRERGFTLVELVIVVAILAILLAIVLVALNPARNFAESNNTQRRSDVNAILNAVHQYMVDNRGTVPSGVTSTVQTIASSGVGTVDLCAALVPTRLADLPLDPTAGSKSPAGANCTAATSYDANYTIKSDSDRRITVEAPSAQNGVNISVTR